MNLNINGHDRYPETNPSRVLNNPTLYAQRQQQQQQQQREASMRSMAIGEMMERARLNAANTANTNNSRSQSPAVGNTGISSQFMDAIQRSDQVPIVDNHQQHHRTSESPSSPHDTNVSPSSRHSRQNRPVKHYPRPPLLNTWQGRGPGHDEFAGMMTDREKQWVVKIQLHQASQTQEEV
jgi:DNA-binding protein H-NS